MDLSYQSNQQQSADPLGGGSMQTKTLLLTRILLLCGAIAGPFFLLTVLIQDYTRLVSTRDSIRLASYRLVSGDGFRLRTLCWLEC
jgi:hypothetical protein